MMAKFGTKAFFFGLLTVLVTSIGCKYLNIAGPGGFSRHVPPTSIKAGETTRLVWEFKGKGRITELCCHFRAAGDSTFRALPMTKVGRQGELDVYECFLPAFGNAAVSVEYYFDSKCDGSYSKDEVIAVPVSSPNQIPSNK